MRGSGGRTNTAEMAEAVREGKAKVVPGRLTWAELSQQKRELLSWGLEGTVRARGRAEGSGA